MLHFIFDLCNPLGVHFLLQRKMFRFSSGWLMQILFFYANNATLYHYCSFIWSQELVHTQYCQKSESHPEAVSHKEELQFWLVHISHIVALFPLDRKCHCHSLFVSFKLCLEVNKSEMLHTILAVKISFCFFFRRLFKSMWSVNGRAIWDLWVLLNACIATLFILFLFQPFPKVIKMVLWCSFERDGCQNCLALRVSFSPFLQNDSAQFVY